MKRIFIVLVFLSLAGCSTAMLARKEDKMSSLNLSVDKFHRAVYWGSLDEASGYVVPSLQPRFMSKARKQRETERLVDLDVQDVTYDESADSANVEVKVRFYKIPNYVVETRRESELWQYDRFDGGWHYRGAEILADIADGTADSAGGRHGG